METNKLARTVGKQFIMYFYQVLHDAPQDLHKFYKEDSILSVGHEGKPAAPDQVVAGVENINKKISTLGFLNRHVHLSIMEAQTSVGDGVLLLVKGILSKEGEAPLNFVRTFFLASQEPQGYYVKNDILRFLPETVSVEENVAPTPAFVATTATKEQKKSTEVKQSVELPSATATPVMDDKPVVVATTTTTTAAAVISTASSNGVAVHGKEKVQESKSKDTPATPVDAVVSQGKPAKSKEEETGEISHKPVAETSAPPSAKKAGTQSPPPPSSWAGIAARKIGAAVTPLSGHPPRGATQSGAPISKGKGTTPSGAGSQVASTTDSRSGPLKTSASSDGGKAKTGSADNSCSFFVRNVPYESTAEALREVFETFGPTKEITIQPKGRAFIEFTTSEAAQKAMKQVAEKTIVIGERELVIEERKKKARGGRSRSRADRRQGSGSGNSNSGGSERKGVKSPSGRRVRPPQKQNTNQTASTSAAPPPPLNATTTTVTAAKTNKKKTPQ